MQTDTTIKKVQSAHSPVGAMGQKFLVAGKKMSMRLWEKVPDGEARHPYSREYETLGYVISGRARLEIEGQEILLEPGDCWLVPPGATHIYHVDEPFTAIEATAPPAEIRDSKD